MLSGEWSERRKSMVTFTICVLLAGAIWTLNQLNNAYTATVSIPLTGIISTRESPPGTSLPGTIQVEVKGRGFTLLRLFRASSDYSIAPDKSSSSVRKDVVSVRELLTPLISPFGDELEVLRIEPSELVLSDRMLHSVKVAVRPSDDLGFSPDHVKSGPSVTLPDSIIVYSEEPLRNDLKVLFTETVKAKMISQPYFTKVKLRNPGKGLRLSQDSVWIYVPVERGTEVSLKIPVRPSAGIYPNSHHRFSDEEELFLPRSVTVTCRIPLSRYNSTVESVFRAEAVRTAVSGDRVLVSIVKAPFWAGNIRWEPTTVHHLTRKNH